MSPLIRLSRLSCGGEADDNGEIVVCAAVRAALAPLLKQIDVLDEAIKAIDNELEAQAKGDEKAKRAVKRANRRPSFSRVRLPCRELRARSAASRDRSNRHFELVKAFYWA